MKGIDLSKLSIYPPTLTGNFVDKKREEIKEYFLNTYGLYEKMFEVLRDDDVFYKKSELTRHPMIFYFGHTATFFVNKLVMMKLISKRINPEFESIFAVGVDEMNWDDTQSSNYNWPSIDEVREYRLKVKELVLNLIDTLPISLPIDFESPMWIILMGIEHERIHIETSAVLHRQMPLECIKKVDEFKESIEYGESPKNSLINIAASDIELGKHISDKYYGWDNEYGIFEQRVEEFKVSKYLVSNAEYLEFVLADGYQKHEYWSEEGLKFLNTTKVKYPHFWILEDGEYLYRTLSAKIKMPQNFPVDVNALEAEAFCNYISKRDGVKYTLPSEAEYEAICQMVGIDEMQSDKKANINFEIVSSCPIDKYEFNGIYDVVGNVWQWSRTPMRPFDGFDVHPAYDDFTVPTFDEKHAIILGSSWASSGNLIMKDSRYAFRRHFYQNAGFRYVVTQDSDKTLDDTYESDALVSQYCEFQYGPDNFGVKNFAIECAKIAAKFTNNTTKALDLGCATGRTSFELAKTFDKVEGIDFSIRFVGVGSKLKYDGNVVWNTKTEGGLFTKNTLSIIDLGYEKIKDKVEFWQGDACNLKTRFNSYDLILATNLIDRLYNPRLFLDNVDERLNKDGVLILTSPYTWQEESTPKELWLGGYKDDDAKDIKTIDSLKELLSDKFNLVHIQDLDFVIKETSRKFQHTISEVSVWVKK